MTRDELRERLHSAGAVTLYRDIGRHRYATHVGYYDIDVVGEVPALPAAGCANEKAPMSWEVTSAQIKTDS